MKEYKLEAVVHVYELAELSEEDKQLVLCSLQQVPCWCSRSS